LIAATVAGCNSAQPAPHPPPKNDIPIPDHYQGVFAVGARPIDSIAVGPTHQDTCHPTFVTDDKVLTGVDGPKVIAEGRFLGRCKNEVFTYNAEQAVKARVILNSVQSSDLRQVGYTQIAMHMVADPVSLIAQVLSRDDSVLMLGDTAHLAKWSGCEDIIRFDDSTEATTIVRSFRPVALGTCTLAVEMLGIKGTVSITVNR